MRNGDFFDEDAPAEQPGQAGARAGRTDSLTRRQSDGLMVSRGRLRQLVAEDFKKASPWLFLISCTGVWQGGPYGVLGTIGIFVAAGMKVIQYRIDLSSSGKP